MKRIKYFIFALLILFSVNNSNLNMVKAESNVIENNIDVNERISGTLVADTGNFRGNTNYSKSNKSSNDSDFSSSNSGGIGYIFDIIYIILRLLGVKGLIILAIIGVPIYLFVLSRRKNRNVYSTHKKSVEIINEYPTDENSFELLHNRDSKFSNKDLLKRVSRIYIEMQQCWMNKDIEPLRAYLEPELYSHLENQLEQLKSENLTNYMKNMTVMEARELKYYEDNKNQCIDVLVRTRCIDYVVDSQGKVVTGSDVEEVFMTYIYTLIRDINAQTEENKLDNTDVEQHICPSCGAPIDIYRSAKCEYCGRILESKNNEWVISNIEAIEQYS